MSWQRLNRKTIYDTRFLRVYEDTVQLPSGVTIEDYSVVSLPSGVIIVATDEEGRLITQYEYKYAIDKTILNLPAGSIEHDDTSVLQVAERELLEEAGYASSEMELIQTLYEYPSKADHLIHIVRAKNARKVAEPRHESSEDIGPVMLLTPDYDRSRGVFDTTYTVSAIALTLPDFL